MWNRHSEVTKKRALLGFQMVFTSLSGVHSQWIKYAPCHAFLCEVLAYCANCHVTVESC
jgi:hypothetical protein